MGRCTSLWEQLKSHIEGQVRRVLITGAFIDAKLEFIRKIHDELNPQELFIGIDPATLFKFLVI